VLVLSGGGVPLQTNTICPLPGRAVRNNLGTYYFGGSFDGTQNFGGITLVGGWTNNNGNYSPGWPTCYIATYAANGSLLWVTSFGPQSANNQLTDLKLDPSGGLYAGYWSSSHGNLVAHLSNTGAFDWSWAQPNSQYAPGGLIKLGGVTTSNCCVLTLMNDQFLTMNRLDRSGIATALGQYPLQLQTIYVLAGEANSEPVIDNLGSPFQVGRCFSPDNFSCSAQWLRKCGVGTDLSDREVTPDAQWMLGRDAQSNVYLAGNNGMLAQYSNGGDLAWSNNFAGACLSMVTDGSGNRFVSFADGGVARLGADSAAQTSFAIAGGTPATGVQLKLTSQMQQVWQIEVSTNLTSWKVLGTVTNTSGSLQFSDPSTRTARARFYRAVPLP
jgi:hypothetical protein